MYELKLSKIGNSIGIILSKELLTRLRLNEGDKLFAVETSQGIELTPYDPAFAKAMSITDKLIQKNKNVLKKLAE
jgi:putative addiction module antidote